MEPTVIQGTKQPAAARVGPAQQPPASPAPAQAAKPTRKQGSGQLAAGAGGGAPKPPANSPQPAPVTGGNPGGAGQPSSTRSQGATQNQGSTPICKLTPMTAPGASGTVQSPCSNSPESIHDESLAYWDISIAVPVTGYKDLSFQSSSSGGANSIVTQSVSRTNAYGMFDIFLPGVDLNNPSAIGFPFVSAGLPISGSPLDKPYFAIAENATFPGSVAKIPGLSFLGTYIPLQIRPMFGWVWVKQFTKVPASGSTPASTIATRALHPQWAIEISIKSVASSLGKSTSTQKNNSTTSNQNSNSTPKKSPSP